MRVSDAPSSQILLDYGTTCLTAWCITQAPIIQATTTVTGRKVAAIESVKLGPNNLRHRATLALRDDARRDKLCYRINRGTFRDQDHSCAGCSWYVMDSCIGLALTKVSTSNQWSLLDGVVKRMNAKRGRAGSALLDADTVSAFLKENVSKEALISHGIWLHNVGDTLIICINPCYGRVRQSELAEYGHPLVDCTCSNNRIERKGDRYLNSNDYNAGRHAVTVSTHKASCPLWLPATTSHLHSWRRGAEKTNHSNTSVGQKRGR